jgi:ankyrin repeat protein
MNFWDIFKNKDKNIEDDIKIKEEEIKKMEKNEKKDKNGKIPVVTFSNKINNLISALKSDKDLVVNPEEEEKNLFVKFGVNLSKKDEEGRNIIHKYSLLQKKDILKSLIEKVQNIFVINEQDDYGNTPLLLACKRNYKFFNSTDNTRKNVLEILLKAGAKLNVFAKKNLWTPVHWLCINGDLESLELLTQYNALFFTPDYKGFFPIDLAGYKV